MQTRSTASSFLLRDGRVLLLHRPAQVRSYPDCWSVVSGKLEDGESALQAAQREITEETGYGPASLCLLAAGDPFETIEEARGTCWRVHPFLWLLRDEADPQLDAENDAFAWARPTELSGFSTVPRLNDALQELLPSLPPRLRDGVAELRSDRARGARELGERMLQILGESLPLAFTWPQWVWGVMELGASRPAMAPLAELSRRLLKDAGPQESPREPAPWMAPLDGRDRVDAADRIVELRDQLDQASAFAAAEGARSLDGHRRVATFSASSTVREAFGLAAAGGDPPRRVMLSPAHPTDEGLAMAAALRGFGYEVELVEDLELIDRVGESSLLLLGADAVFPDGAIANRAGSAQLAARARLQGVPVEVLADEFKYQPRPQDFEPETTGSPGRAQPLFERVDAGYIDRILGLPPSSRPGSA